MKIMIINGPNLNLLGIREPHLYGKETYATLVDKCRLWAEEEGLELTCFQSNHEGEIVDWIQKAYLEHYDGILINPAAYTHTSVAIADALKSVGIPVVEVHLTDLSTREAYRRISYVRAACYETIMGQGFAGYHAGLISLKKRLQGEKL